MLTLKLPSAADRADIAYRSKSAAAPPPVRPVQLPAKEAAQEGAASALRAAHFGAGCAATGAVGASSARARASARPRTRRTSRVIGAVS